MFINKLPTSTLLVCRNIPRVYVDAVSDYAVPVYMY